ncbi:uncharacterized protein [Miscanthus floridulus]|uniref:uncharacterized protein n=1 Tax=Miscanthus floridulus TaxID=154761 RepID=UPI00345AB240
METTDCYCKYEYEASSSESLLLGLLVVAAVAKWHSHLFCGPVHPSYIALDEDFSSDSEAFKSAPIKPSSDDPRKEPISVETTDASKTLEDENPPTSLPNVTKIFPEETPTQEQESDSLPIENDPVVIVVTQTVDSPVQHITGEYIDEDKISSSATSSKEVLSEETRNQLRDILPMLEKDIANLAQDIDSMQRVFLAIKDNLSPDLIKVLSPLSTIEDQAPKVKKALRNLSNCEALLAKKNSNKQEAKELAQLIDNLKNSSLRIEPELNQLETKRAELENVKAAIDRHKSNLAQMPNAIKQKKLEMLTKVKEGSSLENIPRSIEEDNKQIAEVDAIRLKVLKAI